MKLPVEPCHISGFPCHIVRDPVKQQLVAQLKDLIRGLSPHGRFPGPNPCSLERADLPKFASGDHWLCEKTDGTRVLMAFVTFQGIKLCLLVTRAWDVFVVGLRKCPKVWFQGTVFDGELVFSNNAWLWLGFDAMMVAGIPVYMLNLSERLQAARRSMKEYSRDPQDPLWIEFKEYFKAFDKYTDHLKRTTHPVDGTIMTPEHAPVVLGRHTSLYKLKNDGKHTVDFEFLEPDILRIYDPKKMASVQVGKLHVSVQTPVASGSIIEAAWVSGNTWTLVTLRQDKKTSNDMLTYKKTMVNIKENLGLVDLERCWPQADRV